MLIVFREAIADFSQDNSPQLHMQELIDKQILKRGKVTSELV
jgi:hypothetical protein